jgi:hypothetical protein
MGCALAAAGLYWQWQRQPLPSPTSATTEQLVRWLALHDVKRLSNDQQLALVDRFESEWQQATPRSSDTSWVPASWMVRLQSNLAVLKQVWFFSRVDQYAACPNEVRLSFLRQRLDAIARWTEVSASFNTETPPESNPSASWFTDIEHWLACSQGPVKDRVQTALTDGVICWLACYDLQVQPPSVRMALADRIVASLEQGQRTTEMRLPLNSAEHQQLAENAKLLMESWAIKLSKQFVQLPAHQRDEFVDRLLTKIDDWGLNQWLVHSTSNQASSNATQLMATVDTWIARASQEDRPPLHELISHVKYRMLVQQLRQWLPGNQRA